MDFKKRKTLGSQVNLITLLIAVFVLVGCNGTARMPMVSLKSTDPSLINPQPMENRNVLRVGISSVLSPRETLENYQSLADYLQKRIGRPVQLVQRQSYKEVNDLVRDNEVDAAFICSGAYVSGKQENLELLAVPEVKGKTTYQSYIIVSSNSRFHTFQDLKGQVFGFTDPISFSGTIAPTYIVTLLNSRPTDFFKRVVYTYSHDNSIKAVLDNVVSAAGVDSLVYQYSVAKDPALATKIRIIAESPEVGSPPVVVNKTIDSHLKAALLEALLQMDNDSIGKKALQDLAYDRFVIPNDVAYEPIQSMVNANATLDDKK